MAQWKNWFPKHRIPEKLQDLLDRRILVDKTTGRDMMPRFETSFPDGSELVLWLEEPDPEERFFKLFELRLHEPGETPVTRLETDDFDEVLAAMRQVFEEKGGPRPRP